MRLMTNVRKKAKHGCELVAGYNNTFMDSQNYSSDNAGKMLIDKRKTEEKKNREIEPLLESWPNLLYEFAFSHGFLYNSGYTEN